MKTLLLAITAIFFCGCVSSPVTPEYAKTVEQHSNGTQIFNGLDNVFQFHATLMTENFQQEYMNQKGLIYEWTPERNAEQLSKLQKDNTTSTTVWMSFFTPAPQDDNLHKQKSVWTVHLKTGGQKVEGKVTKDSTNFTETGVLFPYHRRYNSSYFVKFPIAVSQVDLSDAELVIAGPLGSKAVPFSH